MEFELAGKVALVTGGGRGIGKSVSLCLAEQGVHVALCGRTPETLEATAVEIRARGVKAWPIVADVSRTENIQRFIETAVEQAGRIDVLVNNAVTSLSATFDELTDEHWRYHIDVKLLAYIRCARLAAEEMKRRGWGRIVNVGGMTARIPAPLRMTNGVVNAGVSNFTKQFADHVAPHGINVNCVHPGYTLTDRMIAVFERRAKEAGVSYDEMAAQTIEDIPIGRLIQPEDIAHAVLFFCSPLASSVTGQSIAVDGGSGSAITY